MTACPRRASSAAAKFISAEETAAMTGRLGARAGDLLLIVADRAADHWRIAGEPQQTTLLGGGPHALDTLRWLMGVRFVETQAYHVAARNQWGAIHTTCALFKAANGAVAKVNSVMPPACQTDGRRRPRPPEEVRSDGASISTQLSKPAAMMAAA